jgi:CRISPR-associated protein Cas5d
LTRGHLVEVKVWGRYACFTRPENKVERLSYPIITPSAAVGLLESIYWKPQFRWTVTEIAVLPHPDRNGVDDWENFMPITLNELSADGQGHPAEGYNLEDHRVQRTCMILRWPCYRIRARARIFANTTNPAAIKRQFDHRVDSGQCHFQPYLGVRDFAASFSRVNSDDEPIESLSFPDLGFITHSAVLPPGASRTQYRFVPLIMDRGRFPVQEPEAVK